MRNERQTQRERGGEKEDRRGERGRGEREEQTEDNTAKQPDRSLLEFIL